MENFKKSLHTPFSVVFLNIIFGFILYSILIAESFISIALIIVVIACALILDRFGVINAVFDSYNDHKVPALISGILVLLAIPVSLKGNVYIAHISTIAVCYSIACLGLNFQMGSTDMTNFAPAAFMGLGAYSVGVAASKFGLSPWIGLLAGIFITGFFGFLVGLPTLKTKGYYLSLVTMAIQIAFTQLINTIRYLGGSDGMSGITKYAIFDFQLYKRYTVFGIRFAPQIPFLIVCVLFLIVFAYISMRVYHVKYGLSLNAIAQDEIAANCLGINISRQKLFAFVIGSIFCGVAGSLMVGLEGYVGPKSYDFAKSLLLICMVILGGMDNTVGIIVGAIFLSIITEKLRDFADYQQLVYGVLLVVLLIVRPNGIIPRRVRKYKNLVKHGNIKESSMAESDLLI